MIFIRANMKGMRSRQKSWVDAQQLQAEAKASAEAVLAEMGNEEAAIEEDEEEADDKARALPTASMLASSRRAHASSRTVLLLCMCAWQSRDLMGLREWIGALVRVAWACYPSLPAADGSEQLAGYVAATQVACCCLRACCQLRGLAHPSWPDVRTLAFLALRVGLRLRTLLEDNILPPVANQLSTLGSSDAHLESLRTKAVLEYAPRAGSPMRVASSDVTSGSALAVTRTDVWLAAKR